jgi:DNA topoisomerase-3
MPKKSLTAAIVSALLKDGKSKVTRLVSEKSGRAYDAFALLDDTRGKFVNFKLDFGNGALKAKSKK